MTTIVMIWFYSLYIYVSLWQSGNTILVLSFFIFQTFDVGHVQKMTGVVHTGGGVFTCSSDFQIKVLEPSMDPATITTLTAHTGDVTNVCVKSEQLQISDLTNCKGILILSLGLLKNNNRI